MIERCGKCGLYFKPGALKYRALIELTSMFDGYIEQPQGDADQNMEALVESLRRQDPTEAFNDVAQMIDLVICRSCRNRLVKEWAPKETRVVH